MIEVVKYIYKSLLTWYDIIVMVLTAMGYLTF